MKKVHLLVIGKLKDKNLTFLEENYLKRIKNPELIVSELKANAENKNDECSALLQKVLDLKKETSSYVVALDETGKGYTSLGFSKLIFEKLESHNQLIFLIGGAEGLNDQVKKSVDTIFSLSMMTLPHKLARLFFIEQVYRAITIQEGHPYHN